MATLPAGRATTTAHACAQGVVLKKALATAVHLDLSATMSKGLVTGINSICAEFVHGPGSVGEQGGLNKRVCGSAAGRAFAMLTAPSVTIPEVGGCTAAESSCPVACKRAWFQPLEPVL